jgi:quercetin dioxygenase-like cupin family protein
VLREVPPGGGELIGSTPDRRVELLCDHDAVHATWSRFGPGRPGADLHVHRRHSDLFYVLEGELVLLLGPRGTPVAVPAGTLVRIPPLVVHGFRAGPQGTRYLNLHAPGRGFAGFLRALRDGRDGAYDQEPPPADGGRPPEEAAIGGGEVVLDRPGLRAVLLAEIEELVVAEVRLDAAGRAPAAHAPRGDVVSLYVLEGELAVTAGARDLRAPSGTWLQLPDEVPYALAAAGGRPARFLAVHAPGRGAGALVRALAGRDGDVTPT